MKGWVCEALVIAGAYLFSQSPIIGGGLIGIGATLGAVKYGIALGRGKIRDDLLSDFHKVLASISKAASTLDYEKFNARSKETIH